MSSLRPLPDIQADLAAATLHLARLAREHRRARVARRLGIVADFDAGLGRAAIAAKWGVDYAQVAAVLHKAGRTERTRQALGLDDSQRADYQRIVRHGVRPTIARAIALRGP
ncbi:MAG: hypothetical protein J0J01_14345 [Reyranella sp.]|uniref:hypothetical protein n=1 Tax=Reyranella sp. TaxID=1929291 RepID=UPI001AD32F3C|nr:hypothetical protein [Reyranella sp.]MBN9088086.1 hypothetical protein [Reyranella sp.]